MKPLLAAAVILAGCAVRHEAPEPPLSDVAERTGLVFEHRNGAAGKYHLPEIMGSGLAVFDYDSDGDLDVYFVQGAPGAGGNKLFRNELIPSGKLRFVDVTDKAGVGHSAWGMGAAVGDYDRDGDPDLLVTNYGANVLYRNNGDGGFTDVTAKAGVAGEGWHTSASFVDYDRDGDPDIYVARYVNFRPESAKDCFTGSGALDYCTPKAYRPVADCLLRNDGSERFVDVSAAARIAGDPAPGLGVVALDADVDGWLDLYVANDGEPNQLWINQRDGTFRNRALEAGVALSEDGMPQAGMGIAVGDYNNDGREDILVTNLTGEGATLYRNDGNLFFSDASAITASRRITFANTGFGTGWFDYNNDGCLDLFVANGAVTIIESQRGRAHPFLQPSQLLEGTCKMFRASNSPGFVGTGRGASFGDIDNDGDIDIVVSNNNGRAWLLLNASKQAQSFRVEAAPDTLVAAESAKGRQVRRIRTDGSYLSASEPAAHFSGARFETVIAKWPEGTTERWAVTNQKMRLKKGTGVPVP